jgi:DNA-binding response OmpR family regulator
MMILDIMMPNMGGMEVCKSIREFSNIPILMLSAKAEDMDLRSHIFLFKRYLIG